MLNATPPSPTQLLALCLQWEADAADRDRCSLETGDADYRAMWARQAATLRACAADLRAMVEAQAVAA